MTPYKTFRAAVLTAVCNGQLLTLFVSYWSNSKRPVPSRGAGSDRNNWIPLRSIDNGRTFLRKNFVSANDAINTTLEQFATSRPSQLLTTLYFLLHPVDKEFPTLWVMTSDSVLSTDFSSRSSSVLLVKIIAPPSLEKFYHCWILNYLSPCTPLNMNSVGNYFKWKLRIPDGGVYISSFWVLTDKLHNTQ